MKGDSLRRQTEQATEWCERNGARLDTATTFRDLGKSGYTGEHRKNPDRNALAAFLKLVERGTVPRGAYLILENLDRLSREHIQPALLLALNLLQAGIRLVQLKPAEMVFDDKSDTLPVMMMMMELSRGHGESAMKSARNGAAWEAKRAQVRAGKNQPPRKKDGRVTRAITSALPAWVEERNGEMHLIPERAAVVKRIFHMAASGYGSAATVKRLTEEGVPAFGDREQYTDEKGEVRFRAKDGVRYGAGVWVGYYVASILKDRRALGEFRPRSRGKPDGDPIPGYFPAVVTEEEWAAARAGAAQRKQKPGRLGKHVNLFAGLLRNARDGDTFFEARQAQSKGGYRVLVNTAGSEARTTYESFPAEAFERAVLSHLAEIDPHDILNGDSPPDESGALARELADVEASLAALVADMDAHGESPTLMKRVRQKEARQAEVVKLLAEARQKAASPLSEAWGQTQSLLAALDSAPDQLDARLRLRSAIRRIVSAVWLLIVRRGEGRLCAVQIWFAGEKRRRDYLIAHRQPRGNRWGRTREGGWKTWSLAEVAEPGALDLRKAPDAEKLEAVLQALDLDALLANGDCKGGADQEQ
jgi:DNA invertase Pin-like site-specific DNA recombinase